MVDLKSDISANRNDIVALRDQISTNKSEFDSLVSCQSELVPHAGDFNYEELMACYSAKRLTKVTGIQFLKSIKVPACVESIGASCFEDCANLLSVTFLPGSCLTRIEEKAFHRCESLKEIEIPAKVESLGNYCFSECTSLQSINIPNSVESLGNYCFSGCTSLQSVTVPAHIMGIQNKDVFLLCRKDLSIRYV